MQEVVLSLHEVEVGFGLPQLYFASGLASAAHNDHQVQGHNLTRHEQEAEEDDKLRCAGRPRFCDLWISSDCP